jgi:hypothetical protein
MNFGLSTYHDTVDRPPDTGHLRRKLTLPMRSSRLCAMPSVSCRNTAQDAVIAPAILPGDYAAAGHRSEPVIERTPVIDP